MAKHSDLIERLLLHPGTLQTLLAGGIAHTESILRIRGAEIAEFCNTPAASTNEYAPLLRAILFYRFDALGDSHRIVQESSLEAASYLHAMIHRREGDFDNARYWYRRTGPLGFFDELHRKASNTSSDFAKQSGWDPYLFTGLCEQHRFGDDSQTRELLAIQQAEFDCLLSYLGRKNAG